MRSRPPALPSRVRASVVTVALAAALLLLPAGASAAAPAKAATVPSSRDRLRAQCLLYGADPKNPWALAHGMVVFGQPFAASDGRKAYQVMVDDYVHKSLDPKLGAWVFERYRPDGMPIDPHPNLLIKSMVLAGLPDSTTFQTPAGKLTLGDLVKNVETAFRHVPQNEEYWEDVGWTLDLLADRLTPQHATFKNGEGKTIDFNEVMDDALAYLELADKDLAAGMEKGLAEVPKRKQGIYAHSCGGLHLVQAVVHWARFPEVRRRWGKRFDRQVDVLFYRLGSEQRQYDTAFGALPQFKLQLATQMLKFYGHFLETTGRLRQDLKLKPTAKQKLAISRAERLLDRAVLELQELHAFERMDELKTSQRQIYLDLIGDSCHAAHGLELWK